MFCILMGGLRKFDNLRNVDIEKEFKVIFALIDKINVRRNKCKQHPDRVTSLEMRRSSVILNAKEVEGAIGTGGSRESGHGSRGPRRDRQLENM